MVYGLWYSVYGGLTHGPPERSAFLASSHRKPNTINFKTMQELLIFLIFAVAVGYLGVRTYRNFSAKQAGCGKGCGCAADNKRTEVMFEKKV